MPELTQGPHFSESAGQRDLVPQTAGEASNLSLLEQIQKWLKDAVVSSYSPNTIFPTNQYLFSDVALIAGNFSQVAFISNTKVTMLTLKGS